MLSTIIKAAAAEKLRHGFPWFTKDEISRFEGNADSSEPSRILDEEGRLLGLGDVDMNSQFALRRIGLADESPDGLIQRHLRRAMERRAAWVEDPRYCRVVNDDGDGLPGLVIDRFDTHYVMRTFTRAMDARAPDIARILADTLGATSVLLRNDSYKRTLMGLESQRPHALYGSPPRWTRVLELGARFSIDLFSGAGTGFFFDQRDVRRLISTMARDARVLDPCCGIGGLFVHAGLHGARAITAFDANADTLELARENAEANRLFGRVRFEQGEPFDLLPQLSSAYDLVLLDSPTFVDADKPLERTTELLRLSVRATRHGGRLVLVGYEPPIPPGALDELVTEACVMENRVAYRLHRPGLPTDFPTVLGSPGAEYLSALIVEVS